MVNQYVLPFLGVSFILLPLLVRFHFWRLKRTGKTAMATVIENKLVHNTHSGSDHGGFSYKAVVEYEIDGVKYTRTSNNGYVKPHYIVGRQVKIYYTDSKQNNFLIDGEDKRPLFIIFLIIGCIILAVTLVIAKLFPDFL